MSAYLTFTRKKTLDVTELKVYWDKIRATFAGHRVKVLVNSWNRGPLRRLGAAGAARQGDSRLLRRGALTPAN